MVGKWQGPPLPVGHAGRASQAGGAATSGQGIPSGPRERNANDAANAWALAIYSFSKHSHLIRWTARRSGPCHSPGGRVPAIRSEIGSCLGLTKPLRQPSSSVSSR